MASGLFDIPKKLLNSFTEAFSPVKADITKEKDEVLEEPAAATEEHAESSEDEGETGDPLIRELKKFDRNKLKKVIT